jgi:hypothetical protein
VYSPYIQKIKIYGGNAFYGCSALTSVTVGNNVISLGKYAFRDCIALTSVMFMGDAPSSVGGA